MNLKHKDNLEKLVKILILIQLAVLPFHIQLHGFFLIITFLLSVWTINKTKIYLNRLFLIFLPFFLLEIISISYSENIDKAFEYIILHMGFILYPIIFSSLPENYNFLKRILNTFLVACLIFCIQMNLSVIYNVIINSENLSYFFTKYLRFTLMEVSLFSMHPPYLGIYLCFSLSIVLFTSIIKSNIIKSIIVAYLLLNTLLISSQTSTFIILSILYFHLSKNIFQLLNIKLRYSNLIIILIPLVCVAGLFTFSNQIARQLDYWGKNYNYQHIFNRTAKTLKQGDEARTENWKSALKLINNHTFLGTGVGDNKQTLQEYRDKNTWSYTKKADVHNQYLGIMVKTGLIGFLLFLLPICCTYLKWLKSIPLANSFLFIVLVSMLTENILDRQKGFIFFSFFFFYFLKKLENINSYKHQK